MHALDAATRLTRLSDDRLRGKTCAAYWNFGGPFGGVTAGLLMRAVLEAPGRQGDPVAITVNFTARIAEGAFDVVPRLVRAGRSTQHWYVELAQGDVVAANASVVLAVRSETWAHRSARCPAVPPAQALAPLPTMNRNAFVQQFDFRFVGGPPQFEAAFDGQSKTARSEVWLNNAVPRPWDFVGLATACDLFFGRIYFVQGTVFPIATVSLTAYFHVATVGLAALGDGPLLGVADAQIFEAGFFDQTAQLWSADGRLVATTTQIVNYRA
jgi:acyl-CoA thioesterase